MPRIDCRPDQVFPEQLEARLSIPAPRPDSRPELVAVAPLVWDGLGWERYAFAIPGGNSHVHLNLTCTGQKPDDFGLHFSLYGTEFAGDFLKPVHATADPLCWEFAIDVPGLSLARREAKIPLTITVIPAVGQTVAPDEPYPWPVYLDSGWTSDDSSGWDSSSGSDIDVTVDLDVDSNNDGTIDENDDPIEGTPPGKIVLFVDDFPCLEDEEPPGCPCDWPRDLARCEFTVSSPDPDFDLNNYTLQLDIGGPFIAWRDSARTSQIPIGFGVPAGSGLISSPFYLEATGEGSADVELTLLQAGRGPRARDNVKAKSVSHIVPNLRMPNDNILATREILEDETDGLRVMTVSGRKDALVHMVRTSLRISEVLVTGDDEIEDYYITGMGPDQMNPNLVNGFSGIALAWSLDARVAADGERYDFSRVKVRFMPYLVIWQNVDSGAGRSISIQNPETQMRYDISAIPTNTLSHERWHVGGVGSNFYSEAATHGIHFSSYSKSTLQPFPVINKPGFTKGYKAWAEYCEKRLAKVPLDKPLTQQKARAAAEEILNEWLIGPGRANILVAGWWHAAEVQTGDWVYNALEWHPRDLAPLPERP